MAGRLIVQKWYSYGTAMVTRSKAYRDEKRAYIQVPRPGQAPHRGLI